MATGRLLPALYLALYLLKGGVCQDQVQEEPLRCFQTSTTCSGSETALPYSDCCATGTESFNINGTCYQCSDLLSFKAETYEVREGDRYISLEVERRVNPGTNIFFFNTIINDDTALAGIDYGQFPDSGVGLINIVLEEESEVTAGVVITDDRIVEYNETFTVSLQALSKTFQPLGGVQDMAVVTIIDDDTVDITLEPSGPLTVNESSPLMFFLNKTGQAERAVQVQIDLSDPELLFSNGAMPDIRTYTFEPSDPPKRIDIMVLDDDIVEDVEAHLVQLRVPKGETGVNLPQDSVIINVLDDGDTVELSLPGAGDGSLTVMESDGLISLPLGKVGSNERPVLVRVFTEPITATAGEDYRAIDMVVEVPSDGEILITSNTSIDGRVEEDEETFRVRLEVPETEPGVRLGVAEAIVSIIDSDTVLVEISRVNLTVTEGESATFLVTGSGADLDRDVSILITSSRNGDIEISPSTVVLSAGQLQSTVAISGIDDSIYEGAEETQLMITTSDKAVIFASPSPTIDVTIVDNDSPELMFSEEVYRFNETAGTVDITVTFEAQVERSHSWTLTSVPITATENEDYRPINQVLLFGDTTRTHTVQFTINDDGFSEGVESVSLELRDSSDQLTTSSLLQILDDEKLLISLTSTIFSVNETEELFFLRVNKSGVTTSDITLNLNIADGSALGGVDYGFFPTSFFPALTLILASETSVDFPIPIINDDIIERTENFNITVEITDDNDGTIIVGDIGSAVIFIEDDDKLRVSLMGGGEVSEGGSEMERELEFTVTRDVNATLDRDVFVSLATADGSATGSKDYISTSAEFTFSQDGPLSFTHTVSVLDDMTVENRENFTVSLLAPPGELGLLLPPPTTVYIIDDDKIQVDFEVASYTVSEGDSIATAHLIKIGDNEIPVTVSVVTQTLDDTAIAGVDYNATIEPIEFASDESRVPIIIPILDDSTVEDIESFTVVLSVAGTDPNVVLGAENTAQITIIDDDAVSVEFEEAEYRGIEGEEVMVAVALSEPSDRTVEVNVVSLVGTADESDFSLMSRTVTFSPGEMRASFPVTFTQDTMCDDREESFSLVLESTDASVTLGQTHTSNVFIEDDDVCTIQFMNDTMVNVVEPNRDTPITLCVGVSTGLQLDRDVRFIVVTEELTDLPVEEQALPDVDFVFDVVIMTLDPSSNMLCFNVTILEDDRPETTKFFNISVIPEDPELVSSRQEITVAIGPTDEPTTPSPMLPKVEFSLAVYTAEESDGFVEITLSISPPPNDTTTLRSVLFSTVDGTAMANLDYIPQINTPVIIEGSSASVLVTLVTDSQPEGEEQFGVQLALPEMLVNRTELGDRTTATVIISDIEEDVFVEDAVTGDPLFIVPLLLTPNSTSFEENPSLCYEIHGKSGSTFNFISDNCTSVNALYYISSDNPGLNFIREIGVKAIDRNNNCVNISVAVDDNCTARIDGDITISGGITVRQFGASVRISVPNCGSNQLVMWVRCREVNSQRQLRFDVTRGLNLSPNSHGLLGQFWNVPVSVTPYTFTGPVVYDLQGQELYLVEILSPDGSETKRQFIAEFYPLSWDHRRPEPCLYAGDQQGGRTLEFTTFNDPVIENNYRLYETEGLFETGFYFPRFDTDRCNG